MSRNIFYIIGGIGVLHSNYEETDLEKLAGEVALRPARDNALVPDQKERSDDVLAV